jgi:signal transduction histidine kinase
MRGRWPPKGVRVAFDPEEIMIGAVILKSRFDALGLTERIGLVGHGLVLLGAAVTAAFFGELSPQLVLLLSTWFIALALIGIAQAQGWGPRWLGWVIATIDLVFAAGTFLASGAFASPILSVFILPVFATGMAYGWMGALGSGGAVVLLVTAIGLGLAGGGLWVMVPTGMILEALAIPAVIVGWLTDRTRGELRALGKASRLVGGVKGGAALEMFARVSELSATLEFEQLLDLALDLSASVLADANGGRDRLRLGMLLLDGDRLRVAASRGLSEQDSQAVIMADGGLVGDAVAQGRTQRGADAAADPVLSHVGSLRDCRDLLAIPLKHEGEIFGALLFAHPRKGFFNKVQVELLEAAARQVAVAMQNARLFQDLEAERERMTEIQEEARRKLARDLHDGPTQSIAAITMRVNFARRLIERDADAATTELTKVEDLARRTTKDLRHMLFTLRPLILESQGLLPALRQLAEKMRDTHGQNVIVQSAPDVAEGLEPGKQAVVFYIAEEAVNNARKHAEAEHIWVRLKKDSEVFTLEVEDDGVGFNVGAVDSNYEQRGSLGMVNMRERTELVDGKLLIRSAEGKGTLITVIVPLPRPDPEPADRPEAIS